MKLANACGCGAGNCDLPCYSEYGAETCIWFDLILRRSEPIISYQPTMLALTRRCCDREASR
jgi:hypothetical protein